MRGKGLAVIAGPVAMLAIAVAVFFVIATKDEQSQRHVTRARNVNTQLAIIHSGLLNAMGAERAFVLAGAPDQLERAEAARGVVERAFDELDKLVASDAGSAVDVAQLRQLAERLPPLPATLVSSDLTSTNAWIHNQLVAFDSLLERLQSMQDQQTQLVAERRNERDHWRSLGRWSSAATLIVGIFSGFIATRLFTGGVRLRIRRLEQDFTALESGQMLSEPDQGGDELGRLSRRLHAVVADRLELEEELKQARQAAEAANHAKSEFLSRMSHELRTPLNSVLGFAQLLEMDGITPEQQKSVGHIVKAGRHLLDLINEVLDISRIESGTLALSPEPVLLREVVEEAAELVRPLATSRDVTLAHPVSAGCDQHVLADRQRIKQVLLNLLANAVKYNRPGGSVNVRCEPVGDGRMRLSVHDTGRGISPDLLDRLFTPFDRLGAEAEDIEGTGVGLPLSLRLTEAMGGELTVETQPGVGSVFSLTLKRAEVPHPRTALPLHVVTKGEGRRHVEHTVLYIEDNLSNLRLMEEVFRHRPHYKLMHSGQGRLGLEIAGSHSPSIVLLDLHLPDMPGVDVLRELRLDPQTAAIPVFVVSADATPGQVQRLKAEGANGYLTKPFDVAQILEILDGISTSPEPADGN